jgi:VIT1/CCC1 family predicted Fe2+/Mn2+ transporter
MALGEYVSVSSQRDAETAMLAKERHELSVDPAAELAELTAIYRAKGLTAATARKVAQELTAHDPLTAHAEAELGLDPDELTNPWHAAVASAVSFAIGALLPLLTVILSSGIWRVPVTVIAVLAALALTGAVSARIGGNRPGRPVLRVVVGGALGLAVTYGIGHLVGTTLG